MKLFYLALSLIFFFVPFSILGETMSDLIWNNGLYYKKGSKNPFNGIVTGEINGSSFGPTPESSEVKLFKIDEIPWDELAFPTVKRTLQLFLEEDRNNVFNEVLKY